MHGDPILFFDKSLPLLVFTGLWILSKNKKFWTWEFLILLLFLLENHRIFTTNVGIYDLQLSFFEANFTWRNDITCKNVLNRPSCDEIDKSAFSRVLQVTYFIPCSKKDHLATFPIRFISKTRAVIPQFFCPSDLSWSLSRSNYNKSLENLKVGKFWARASLRTWTLC